MIGWKGMDRCMIDRKGMGSRCLGGDGWMDRRKGLDRWLVSLRKERRSWMDKWMVG